MSPLERAAAAVIGVALVLRAVTSLFLESGSTPRLVVGIGFFSVVVVAAVLFLVGLSIRTFGRR